MFAKKSCLIAYVTPAGLRCNPYFPYRRWNAAESAVIRVCALAGVSPSLFMPVSSPDGGEDYTQSSQHT